MNIYKITILNYSNWQKDSKTGRKTWFAHDCNYWFDSKIVTARQICSDSQFCFPMLIAAADENGIVEMNERALKEFFKIRFGVTSNNFDFKKRLDALEFAGIISVETEVQSLPKQLLNPSKSHPKKVQTSSNFDPNTIQSESKDTFEEAINQSDKGSFTNKQTNKTYIYSDEFSAFWSAYPKTDGGKKPAYEAYKKARKTVSAEVLLSAAQAYKNKTAREGTAPKYIKMAQGWLNENRWEVDYSIPEAAKVQARLIVV